MRMIRRDNLQRGTLHLPKRTLFQIEEKKIENSTNSRGIDIGYASHYDFIKHLLSRNMVGCAAFGFCFDLVLFDRVTFHCLQIICGDQSQKSFGFWDMSKNHCAVCEPAQSIRALPLITSFVDCYLTNSQCISSHFLRTAL